MCFYNSFSVFHVSFLSTIFLLRLQFYKWFTDLESAMKSEVSMYFFFSSNLFIVYILLYSECIGVCFSLFLYEYNNKRLIIHSLWLFLFLLQTEEKYRQYVNSLTERIQTCDDILHQVIFCCYMYCPWIVIPDDPLNDNSFVIKWLSFLVQVDDTLDLFNELQLQHQAVATKTKTLHDACDRLVSFPSFIALYLCLFVTCLGP